MSDARRRPLGPAILDILRMSTDEAHPIRQNDLLKRLAEMGYPATRKTLHRNLEALKEAGFPVAERGGWYYEHEFCPVELDLLVNSLLFNTAVPYHQSRELIGKISRLGGEHYTPTYQEGVYRLYNPQFFYSLEMITRAIEDDNQIMFHYCRFDVDKKLHPRMDEDGSPHEYLVNPYRVVMTNGRHYLIGNVDKYDSAAHFRVDRLQDVRVVHHSRKLARNVRDFENGFDLSNYMAEHVYMFTGQPRDARLRIERAIAGDVLDSFGMDVVFENITDTHADAVFRSDYLSLKAWLARYGERAELITPAEL